ncbi:PIN domain-containing protein [Neobacillus sp. SM06]|uniref:PIN domain-containing protein n=1 Tax=Neobacillus sp. SM06 TaxID=3422492 RepID=UPI003D2B0285
MYLLDANVIVRFLTNDDPVQSPAAFQLFKKAIEKNLTFMLHPLVIAECCYVLESKRYSHSKKEIAENLSQLIASANIKTLEMDIVLGALVEYCKQNVDFTDAFLAVSVNQNAELSATIT